MTRNINYGGASSVAEPFTGDGTTTSFGPVTNPFGVNASVDLIIDDGAGTVINVKDGWSATYDTANGDAVTVEVQTPPATGSTLTVVVSGSGGGGGTTATPAFTDTTTHTGDGTTQAFPYTHNLGSALPDAVYFEDRGAGWQAITDGVSFVVTGSNSITVETQTPPDAGTPIAVRVTP